MGGRVQDGIPVYQTARGRIKDEWTNEEHLEEIVQFLYDRGIEGIKIWPFDATGRALGGAHITPTQIDENLDGVRRIRDTLGKNMEVALEFHSLWSLPDAMDIARALEPYDIMWLEDMLLQGNMASYATLARETSIPVAVSERLATRYPYREVLEEKGCDIAMFDVTWCGGITAAKRIAELADTYYVPSAPHTHGGPILWLASIHLAITLRNLYIMESTYHHYTHQFPNYIADYPVPEGGVVQPTDQPGFGLNVQPNLFERADVAVTEIGRV
jgi:L-alanine-DL-glutamate epimerase-like enolase superfamily enzyme